MRSIPIQITKIEGEALRLTLLGRVDLWVTGNVRVLRYAKLQALLARLVMSAGAPLRRSYLAELLWPDMPEDKGLQNLRRAIFNLKTALGEAGQLIAASRDAITLAPQNIWLDVAHFTAAPPNCVAPDASCQPCLATMQSKAELYVGEFMAGFTLADCAGFEDWLQVQRETLHGRALALLERLASCHEQAGALNLALPFALRQSELEPWDEAACRRVMRLYARNDQNSAAIDHFKNFRRHLKTELGVLPSEETQQLAQTIQSSRLPQESLPIVKMQALPTVLLRPTERRQVTVLYCELSLQQVADPEDVLMLLKPAQSDCASIIAQHGGHIVQAHGGGLLAYFGYPKAQEDAARRAVLAALAATRDAANDIDIRVGIHTGLIITSVDSNLPDSVGRTSKMAIQIRELAGAGQTVISGETHRLVGGYFNCSSLESSPLRRRAYEQHAFRVLKESGARSRLDAAARLTPLVGRSTELAQLMGLWQETVQGANPVVLIQGDAGIGKSRLLHAMKDRLTGTPHAVREMRCFPEFSQSPFQPLIAMLEAQFGFEVGDVPELKSVKLRQYLQTHYPASAEQAIPLISDLLFLPSAEPESHPSADARKTQTTTALLDFLQALASSQPTLLVLEDAHWVDPSTLDLLSQFVNKKSSGGILTAITARTEFSLPWSAALATTITLQPLAKQAIGTMLASLRSDIAQATLLSIVERADGVPLFAEEMANMAKLDQSASIPDTLHDLLVARLDHVGEAKYTAQLASAIGRKFDLNLLAKVFPHGPESLASTLSALVEAGLIVKGHGSERKFKHALIQEAAYESQIKADRQAAHQRIAQVLQSDFGELVTARPEILARHLSDGGSARQAIGYWLKAGQRGVDRSAYLEAIENYKSGLALLPQLSAADECDALEFELQLGLGAALVASKGHSSTEAALAFGRAIDLAQPLCDDQRLFRALWGMWQSSLANIGDFQAISMAQNLMALAERGQQPVQLQQALYAMGHSLLWSGQIDLARTHLERAIDLYHPSHHAMMVVQNVTNIRVASGALLAAALWMQGYSDQARRASEQALSLARQLDHPASLGYVLCFSAGFHRLLMGFEQCREFGHETMVLSQKHGLVFWRALGAANHGWALSMQGQAQGTAQIQQCLDAVRVNMGGVKILFLTPLCEALVQLGQFDKALPLVLEALDVVNTSGYHYLKSEYHRLHGLCLLGISSTNAPQAEACFHEALAISRKQGAKSLELRAASSLARLWLTQGKENEAKCLLEDTQHWFSEGFDTPDFRESAELLSSLSLTPVE